MRTITSKPDPEWVVLQEFLRESTITDMRRRKHNVNGSRHRMRCNSSKSGPLRYSSNVNIKNCHLCIHDAGMRIVTRFATLTINVHLGWAANRGSRGQSVRS